jgi:hypothetical protein
MKIKKVKRAPASLKNCHKWSMSRQDFLKSMLYSFAITQMSFLSSCSQKKNNKLKPFSNKLDHNQLEIVKIVQSILFPNDRNGPGALDIHAHNYLQWVMSDPWLDREEVEYIINGTGWVDETAQEDYSKGFTSLSREDQEQLINKISKESWGEDWLSVILTYIFEALLCDPLYGGNPDETGWKWLEVYPGYPRPDKSLLYGEILETVNG